MPTTDRLVNTKSKKKMKKKILGEPVGGGLNFRVNDVKWKPSIKNDEKTRWKKNDFLGLSDEKKQKKTQKTTKKKSKKQRKKVDGKESKKRSDE